jgi:hypothetical protein
MLLGALADEGGGDRDGEAVEAELGLPGALLDGVELALDGVALAVDEVALAGGEAEIGVLDGCDLGLDLGGDLIEAGRAHMAGIGSLRAKRASLLALWPVSR